MISTSGECWVELERKRIQTVESSSDWPFGHFRMHGEREWANAVWFRSSVMDGLMWNQTPEDAGKVLGAQFHHIWIQKCCAASCGHPIVTVAAQCSWSWFDRGGELVTQRGWLSGFQTQNRKLEDIPARAVTMGSDCPLQREGTERQQLRDFRRPNVGFERPKIVFLTKV